METHAVDRITDNPMDRKVTIRINAGLDRACLIHNERNAALDHAQQHHSSLTRPVDDPIGHIADLVLERLLGQAA